MKSQFVNHQSSICGEHSRTIVHRLSSIVCCLFVLCVSIPGCGTSSSERVAAVKNAVNQATAVSQLIDAGAADLEKVLADSRLLLIDPNVPDEMKPAIEKIINDASGRLAKLKLEKQKVAVSIAQYQAILNNVDVNNVTLEKEIQLYAVGANQAAPYLPAPYSGYVYLGSALAAIFAGLIASIAKNMKQNQQLNQNKTVLTEVITSVDALLNSPIITNKESAKQILQKNQAGITQDVVDAVHDPLQNTGPG